jgi:hypothetical protein
MALLLMPPLLAYLWWVFGRRLPSQHWLRILLAVLAPLLLYLYIPIRGAATSSLDGSYVNSLSGFIRHVAASGYSVFLSGSPALVHARGLAAGFRLFQQQFGALGLALALIGAVFLWGRQGQRLLLGTALLLNVLFAIAYKAADIEVFFIPAFVLVAVLLALGLDFVLKVLLAVAKRAGVAWAATAYALAIVCLVSFLLPLPLRWLDQDRSHDWAVHDLGRSWLLATDPNSAIVAILGETTLMRYFQVAEGLRPDVELYAADDEQVRLETVRWLLGKGRPTYLTRPLPGAPEEFDLDAAGPLVRLSSLGESAVRFSALGKSAVGLSAVLQVSARSACSRCRIVSALQVTRSNGRASGAGKRNNPACRQHDNSSTRCRARSGVAATKIVGDLASWARVAATRARAGPITPNWPIVSRLDNLPATLAYAGTCLRRDTRGSKLNTPT